ncbi:MAG: hypothetical protein ABIJ21_09215 [Nanoarchaeota archaeon]
MKKRLIIILVVVVILLIVAAFMFLGGCTKEALMCPDGTSVGRTLPFCQFKPCP